MHKVPHVTCSSAQPIAPVTDTSNDSEPNNRVIITPTSYMDDEITVINNSDVGSQDIIASITTPNGDPDSC
ncbi:unnamed protein product [Schistocephalus solidus]|uniref:Uncharacterized protein n=1 Tax=Schistocephalus solidus TaxID=70667 RepID=A0A183SFT9_SCHSO|nr:unnamed protein product [Schistocephalus solidus]